ncbi:hypothetical protein [Halalkalicoccus tibetensis]|uniref:PGF-CTERM protein n=1 Tax=Halalkalicoccus tibetensis TaxID=175632 RepID=A0ABD5V263_9EURY
MGEKKKTLFEINVENFEFSPSPRFGDELAETVEELEGTGSKLGLFGSEAQDEGDEESSGGLFSRKSSEDELEDAEGLEETEGTDVDVEEPEEESGSPIALVIGLLFLLVVAAAAKKFVVEGETEEYEEVELSEYEN